MKLNVQKQIAARTLNCSPKRVKFDTTALAEIKEAITKSDIRKLINNGKIQKIQEKGVSRARANKIRIQKSKGRRKGHGSRKGGKKARTPAKALWIARIRLQRKYMGALRKSGSIANDTYRDIYKKAKGGFFRSKRHLEVYLKDHNLVLKK